MRNGIYRLEMMGDRCTRWAHCALGMKKTIDRISLMKIRVTSLQQGSGYGVQACVSDAKTVRGADLKVWVGSGIGLGLRASTLGRGAHGAITLRA